MDDNPASDLGSGNQRSQAFGLGSDQYSSPYFLHSTDNVNTVKIQPPLDGSNYATWSKTFFIAASARRKGGFLRGSVPMPSETDPYFDDWATCNGLVLSWLLASVSPKIASTLVHVNKASDAWNYLLKRFETPDVTRISYPQETLSSIVLGSKSIDDYYSELVTIWEELKVLRPPAHCECGGCLGNCYLKYEARHDQDRVIKFLNGLDSSYASLRSDLMRSKPFPSLDMSYNAVRVEESQRLHHSERVTKEAVPEQTLAMNVYQRDGTGGRDFKSKRTDLYCVHCKQTGHTKDRCFYLMGFPKNWKGKKKLMANTSLSDSQENRAEEPQSQIVAGVNQLTLSNDQIMRLLSLVDSKSHNQPTPKASNVVAHRGLEDPDDYWGM